MAFVVARKHRRATRCPERGISSVRGSAAVCRNWSTDLPSVTAGQPRLPPLGGVGGTAGTVLLLSPPAVLDSLGPVVRPYVDDRRRRDDRR